VAGVGGGGGGAPRRRLENGNNKTLGKYLKSSECRINELLF